MSEFRIRVLVGGNVVLVETSGHEPEMFVPLIVNNRLTLQNVIEKRRCCEGNSNDERRKPLQNKSVNGGNFCRTSMQRLLPLANSTPEKTNRSFVNENTSPVQQYSSPDVVRRAVVHNKNVSVGLPGLAPGLKVVRLHRVHTPNTPNKLARIAPTSRTHSPVKTTSISQRTILRNLSNVSSFKTPPSIHLTRRVTAPRSPNQSFLRERVDLQPGSATKWRKCITPQRTYIRRSSTQNTSLKLKRLSVKPLQFAKNGKLVPDFRLNPTKCPVVAGRIQVKRRKLVIDRHLAITPKSFKHQLKNTQDLKRTNFQLPKSRTEYIFSQHTAFDLLTNSSYYPRIAKELNAVFRHGCLNKRAETILKYKQLTAGIPNIETV